MTTPKLTGTDIARVRLLLQSGLFKSEEDIWQQEADILNNAIDAKLFSRRLEEKAQELYGNPFDRLYGNLFDRLPNSHKGRVRSEVAREESCKDADLRPSWEKFSAKEWALALQGLTPGGSEFLTPAACVAFVRERNTYPPIIIRLCTQNKNLLAALKTAYKLLTGLLTDNQLDFVPAGGRPTARDRLHVIDQAIIDAEK